MSLRIDILDPKAHDLLRSMVDRQLISISSDEGADLFSFAKKMRAKNQSPITLEEITAEVEAVRTARHARESAAQGHS